MALQAPSVLARLPRPLSGTAGKCQFAEVYSLEGAGSGSGSKKRKRYEVAAAIDGEGVNIYNIQFPGLMTSYALPPESSTLCPPLSLKQKSSLTSPERRRTYCAISGSDRRIRCFLEEPGTGSQAAPVISSTSFVVNDTDSPTTFLGAMPVESADQAQDSSFDIIGVHEDGRVRRLSSDLMSQRWSVTISGHSMGTGRQVQAGFVVSFDDARKSLFKKRHDLAAIVLADRSGPSAKNPSVLVLVSQPTRRIAPSGFQVHLYSVPAYVPSDGFVMSDAQRLRPLITLDLPEFQAHEMLPCKSVHWSANFGTGELSLSFDAGFITYDVSQYSPKITSSLTLSNQRFSSLLKVSPRAIVAANEISVAVYNTQYQSVQAEISLKEVLAAAAASEDCANVAFEFVSYYPKISMAVARCGLHLFSFDLGAIRGLDLARRKSRGGQLIDAIGKGVVPKEAQPKKPRPESSNNLLQAFGLCKKEEADQWAEIKSELEAAARAKDAAKFDLIVKSCFGSDIKTGKERKLPSSKEFVDPEKISYLLSMMFSTHTPTANGPLNLGISFLPQQTFQWLIQTGRLNSSIIHAALQKSARPRAVTHLSGDALIWALLHPHKGSIKLLLQVLRSPVLLDAIELATALRVILEFARAHATNPEGTPKSLTETSHKPGEPSQDVVVAPRPDASARTSSHDSESTVTSAIAGLNLTLTRLHSQPTTQVSAAIRTTLSNSDALSIINHLRHSLATGGFTSRFSEEDQTIFANTSNSNKKIPRLSLPTIVDLLNACIDAIGPSGWVSAAGFSSGQDSEATLIADLKSEISAALAGVEEATYLKGILREFIRCCETATGTSATSGGSKIAAKTESTRNISKTNAIAAPVAGIKRKERHNGADIVVYQSPEENGPNSDTKILPLSLRLTTTGAAGQATIDPAAGVGGEPSKTKVLKSTGEVRQRSTREIGYMQRKAVGKYSFERIIV